MIVRIKTLVLGPLETNAYVLRSGDDCAVVDPGMMPEPLLEFLRAEGTPPGRILLTHGHGDHLAGVADVRAAFPAARLCCPADDAAMLPDARANLSAMFGLPATAPAPDELLRPGDVVKVGESAWLVLDTSGHTPGGVSFYCESAGAVIVGDALFAGSIGRTDFPGADEERLLRNIRRNLLSLPDETKILPGHGPATTVEAERNNNPFLMEF